MASFRKLDSGWEYRIIYKDVNGKRKEKSKRGFTTKTLAKTAAIKAEQEINILDSEMLNSTFYEYSKQWAEVYKRPHVTAKTWQTYSKNFKHIKHYFGSMKIKDITPTFYQKVLNEFGEIVAQQTLDKFHYQIKGTLKSAVRDGIVRYNVADGAIVKSQVAKTPKEEKFLEENDYLNLIEISKEKIRYTSYFTIYLIAVTGLRFAEVQGLTWDDVDFDNGFLDINKSFDYSISQRFAPTKNEQSIRKVPIDQNTIEILKQYKENYYQPNKLGRICYGASNNATNKAIKLTTGKSYPTNHTLRHTYASYLIMKGVDLISISQLLGHENLNITLKIYAHQLDKLKEKNDQVIKDIFYNI